MVSVLSIFIKVLKLFRRKISFITDISQWIGLFFYIFSIIFVLFHRSTYQSECDCISKETWRIGAFAVLLGWSTLLNDLSKFPHIGIIINMLLSITLTFIKLIPVAALLIFTFALPFYMLLARPVSSLVFQLQQ